MYALIGTLMTLVLVLLVVLFLSGCGLQKLEDFPQNANDWKTTVQKAREARNPKPEGGE
jgi:uncharacterized protein HemY